ncbi:MAG: hypothetical protein F6K30_11445 [Cyanothece sp. SIO2G6]|nr:hypothetical protein [Cyanothece sp. SIO2G6]
MARERAPSLQTAKADDLDYVQLENQMVVALRDPRLIASIKWPEPKGFSSRHDEYLRDRLPDLQPLCDRTLC